MANICSNHLSISGNKENIASLTKKIMEQDKELLELFFWFEKTEWDYGMWKDTLNTEPESIDFSFGSKWAFPFDEFNNLVAAYPTLEFEGSYEESAMSIFGKVAASNGIASYTDIEPIDYYTEFNEDFAHERLSIKESRYNKFLKHVLEDENEDLDHLWYYLEPLIIDRLKKEDLPLFINREWRSDDAKEKYLTKLKGKS